MALFMRSHVRERPRCSTAVRGSASSPWSAPIRPRAVPAGRSGWWLKKRSNGNWRRRWEERPSESCCSTTTSSRGGKKMWCVADLNEDYIDKMEDVLETYERPYDAKQPVVCLDEKPVTLHADVRESSPARPGRETRRDSEYERCGTANVFRRRAKSRTSFHLPHSGPLRIRVRKSAVRVGPALSRSPDRTPGDGQPQQPPPEILNRPRGRGDGERGLELLYDPLHAQTRELAQSGGTRGRPVGAAMPRQQENPGSEDAETGSPCMESADESEQRADQLELRPQIGPAQVWL